MGLSPFQVLGSADHHFTILPLGDSITYGVGSSNMNGYRDALRSILHIDGYDVTFLGTENSGTMSNNNNEGFPGATISLIQEHILDHADISNMKPDIILLHAGTNDWAWDPSRLFQHIQQNYTALLDTLEIAFPSTIVVVASIIHSTSPLVDEHIATINDCIQHTVIPAARRRGRRIVHADMWADMSPTELDYADLLHPNDSGYSKMANIWAKAISNSRDICKWMDTSDSDQA